MALTVLEQLLADDGFDLPRGGGAEKSIQCFFPDHDDRTASMSVNVAKGVYNCHGCGKSGNAYKYLTELRRLSPRERCRRSRPPARPRRTRTPPSARPRRRPSASRASLDRRRNRTRRRRSGRICSPTASTYTITPIPRAGSCSRSAATSCSATTRISRTRRSARSRRSRTARAIGRSARSPTS